MKRKIFLVYLIMCIVLINAPLRSGANTIKGTEAPPLNGIKFIDNNLPDIGNKFVLIDFWATWCAPCIKSLPHINQLAEKYKGEVVFLAISDEKEEAVRRFLEKREYPGLFFGIDMQKNLYSGLNIRSVPHYCLISPENIIIDSGNTSVVTESLIDSLLANYSFAKPRSESKVQLEKSETEKLTSIEILECPGSVPYFSQSGYTFIARDSLKVILPYFSGAVRTNRLNVESIPGKMVEVKLFSREISLDSLKKIAYEQLLASYGISENEVQKEMKVYNFSYTDSTCLMNNDTFVEEGVMKKRYRSGRTFFRFDNYTFGELVEFLERAYYPQIFYAHSDDNREYDWELEILDPETETWAGFEKLQDELQDKYKIEIRETEQNETITVYQ